MASTMFSIGDEMKCFKMTVETEMGVVCDASDSGSSSDVKVDVVVVVVQVCSCILRVCRGQYCCVSSICRFISE